MPYYAFQWEESQGLVEGGMDMDKDDELVSWMTRGGVKEMLEAKFQRPPTDEELDEVIRQYKKCDCDETTGLISSIADNLQH